VKFCFWRGCDRALSRINFHFSASADKTIKVLNLATNKEIYTLNGHNNYVISFLNHPSEKSVFLGKKTKKTPQYPGK
jgi:WD40 repeat protein